MCIRRRLANLNRRLLISIIMSLFFLFLLSSSPKHVPPGSFSNITSTTSTPTIITITTTTTTIAQPANSLPCGLVGWKDELDRSRIAVCLVGGARRFELTGPSIMKRVLKVYPNADLFLHGPFDKNAFKFLLLKNAPRIASVRIFTPQKVPETESQRRVLTGSNSPRGIQGLLLYFSLVEGCLTMIKSYQHQNNFTYDWIIRTRVDSYWSAPLGPEYFIATRYVVPSGSSYGGLNDRFGIGTSNASLIALSRLSLIPRLDTAGFRQLNSEAALKAQLTTQRVPYLKKRLPFCIVSDRRYAFPPWHYGVPVAAMSSPGPLSGAKCRPCRVACTGKCAASVMSRLDRGWSWMDYRNRSLQLCDASKGWEEGWEKIFDNLVGMELANGRKKILKLELEECINEWESFKRRSHNWDAPSAVEICTLGLQQI